MKKVTSRIGAIAFMGVLIFQMYSCDSSIRSNVNDCYYDYEEEITNTTDGLSDLQKTILEAEKAEEETRRQTVEFLNKAYGYDVSSYVD